MQDVFPTSIAINPQPAAPTRRLRFMDVLNGTLAAFAQQPALLIGVALVCFGAGAVVGGLVYAAALWREALQGAAYFANTTPAYYLQMQVQAAIGAFTFLLGRGIITWLAQQHPPASLRTAITVALHKWKPLLTSTLLYGLIISVAMVGVVWLLRELQLDTSNYRWFRNTPQGILTLVAVRATVQIPPDPGSPFTELYAATRYDLARTVPGYLTWNGAGFHMSYASVDARYALAGLVAIVLMVATETLLCMRTAAVMTGDDTSAFGWIQRLPPPVSRHFWRVMVWRWGVRLAITGVTIACLVLPMALQQSVIASDVIREVRSYWPYLFHAFVQAAGGALVFSLGLAFSIVFEARLFAALQASSQDRQNLQDLQTKECR